MPHRTALIVALVIIIGFATVVVSSTLSGGDSGARHTMPDGSGMDGEAMP